MNTKLLLYALHSLKRYRFKNIFIYIVMTLLVSLLAMFSFTQNTIYTLKKNSIANLPDIIIENQKGGRFAPVEQSYADRLLEIHGVENAVLRVYGYYRLQQADIDFLVWGVDIFEDTHDTFLNEIVQKYPLDSDSMVVSKPLYTILKKYRYTQSFHFIDYNLHLKKLKITGTFHVDTLHEPYIAVVSKENVQQIFGYKPSEYTDVAIYLTNQEELLTIVSKIQQLYPNAKIQTKEDMLRELSLQFDYRGGFFISLFIVSIFTFFMIVFERASGINSSEKKEIGVLKAIGWRVEDVLHVKLYESFFLSLGSFLSGVLLAYLYVCCLDAPLLQEIFTTEHFEDLHVTLGMEMILFVFLMSVPVYIAAVLLPAWKVATTDADEVMR